MEDLYPGGAVIIGGTTGSWAFGTSTGAVLDRELSYVTPENDFKQSTIHPDNATWNAQQADAWVGHIAEKGQVLRMHGPIGPQCSRWARADDRTAAELETNMTDFLTALCDRYDGLPGFEYMDVVNETVADGDWLEDKPGPFWESPWYKIGQDTDDNGTPLYIGKAFEIAQLHAPNTKLIYNHHEEPANSSSWDLVRETIFYLRNRGLRVDGIGWQAHVDKGWETPAHLNALRELIRWAHANDLEFHVTEASVWLKEGISSEALEEQADTYRAILEVLLQERTSGRVGWNTWHIDDSSGWHPEWYPALFDASYVAKPAYYAVQEALEDGG